MHDKGKVNIFGELGRLNVSYTFNRTFNKIYINYGYLS